MTLEKLELPYHRRCTRTKISTLSNPTTFYVLYTCVCAKQRTHHIWHSERDKCSSAFSKKNLNQHIAFQQSRCDIQKNEKNTRKALAFFLAENISCLIGHESCLCISKGGGPKRYLPTRKRIIQEIMTTAQIFYEAIKMLFEPMRCVRR